MPSALPAVPLWQERKILFQRARIRTADLNLLVLNRSWIFFGIRAREVLELFHIPKHTSTGT